MKTLLRGGLHARRGGGGNRIMKRYLDIFNAVKTDRADEFRVQHGLIIKTGEGLGAAILKLLKPSWTTDGPDEILNTNGLFFGIWVDADCETSGIARYNLHAKKLRFIKGQTFAARDFARRVRARGRDELATWPNLTYPKGPITLFQGHVPLDFETLQAETSMLMARFAAFVPSLENVLAE
jgi:hypothetical protein